MVRSARSCPTAAPGATATVWTQLVHLYTVWALRHLYLEEFKRWPGRQFSAHPFYSLAEFKDDEFCGCDAEPPQRYGECCKPQHLKRSLFS